MPRVFLRLTQPLLWVVLGCAAASSALAVEPLIEPSPGMGRAGRAGVELGSVARIEPVDVKPDATGAGAVAGGVVGGAIGAGIARRGPPGPRRAAAVGVGAVGGHAIERRRAADAAPASTYDRVVVSFDNGTSRVFNDRELAGMRVGDRVRLENGVLGWTP